MYNHIIQLDTSKFKLNSLFTVRYHHFNIFRFDLISLYCLIYKIAQNVNVGSIVFSQLKSLILDYEPRKCIKANIEYKIFDLRKVSKRTGAISEESISLIDLFTAKRYPELLHLVVYGDFAQNVVYLSGTSPDAVFIRIWIAICDCLLLIISLKMNHIEQNLYSFSDAICQILFESTLLNDLFDNKTIINLNSEDDRQFLSWCYLIGY